jgi:adenosine kinase
MTILVSGSLAFDRLADYPGLFRDSILADKLDILNVCFLIEKVVRFHGGTAGNIAYNLYKLGESPLIISSLGDDSDGKDYLKRISDWRLSKDAIKIAKDMGTSGVYIFTDKESNQLSFFTAGAMKAPADYKIREELKGSRKDHLAIVSPGGIADMQDLCRAYREKGVRFIFDPGQQVPVFSGKELLEMLEGAYMLMTNEYELDLLLKKTNMDNRSLFQKTGVIVTTLGAKGSLLVTPQKTQHILPVPVKKVVNPTGAGDAYRAGLIKAIHKGLDILSACRIGSSVASFCVESMGTQEHTLSIKEVLSRCNETYGTEIKL